MSYHYPLIKYSIDTWEGGLSDHPADPGGTTKYGLSLMFAKLYHGTPYDGGTYSFDLDRDGDVDGNDIKLMDYDTVINTFNQTIYMPLRLYEVANKRIAWKVFDISLNLGSPRGARYLQRALGIEDDGIIGSQTMRALGRTLLSSLGESLLMHKLCELQMRHYVKCVTVAPKMIVFLSGWTNRAFDVGEKL